MKGTPCKMRTIRRPPVPHYPMAIRNHNYIASIWSFGVLRLSASRISIDSRWMVDDELLSQGYRLLAESRWSILVFRLPHIYCNQGIPSVLLTQTLTSVSPGGSSAASQRDTKSTLTSPRSLGLRNPIRWSLLFTQTNIRSFPCYTKN